LRDSINALIITDLFPSRREPTRGLFNFYRFQALGALCPIRVVAPVPLWRRAGRPTEWLRVPSASIEGIQTTYPTYRFIPRLMQSYKAVALYRSVRSHVRALHRQTPFNVILGAFAFPNVVAAAHLANEFRCPLVALVMGSDMNVLARVPELREQIRWGLTRAGRVIAVSQALRQRVLELGIDTDRVIAQHNGVDGVRFVVRDRRTARSQLGVSSDAKIVCFVGNLAREKGPDVLLAAMSRQGVSSSCNFEVVFLGDGELKKELLATVKDRALERRVRFLGRQPPATVSLWLTAADLVCLPSRREGCPNVVLEALASGRPVIASRVGGVPELVDERNGILVAPDDSTALAEGIAAGLQRSWDPNELRGTVSSLTWEETGHVLYDALARAMDEFRR
jgi:glycosyltransferase involved in cell wall biosynthesis